MDATSKTGKPFAKISTITGSLSFAMVIIILFSYPMVCVAKTKQAQEFPALEVQSMLMSFSDQLMAEVDQATHQYLFQGEPKSPKRRMAVSNGRLNVCTSAVSIAASRNPEIALLDMITMVKLYMYTIEDNWIPKVLGPEAKIFLEVFGRLEQQLQQVADDILSKEQIDELNSLLVEWREKNKDKLAFVAKVRFGEFSELRHSSSLFDKDRPGGLLKKVGEATQEIERTRLLAERALYLAERQPKLIAWQVEQVFYNLVVTEEATSLVSSIDQLPDSADHIATTARKIAIDIDEIQEAVDLSSEANVDRLVGRLSNLSGQIITHTVSKLWLTVLLLGLFTLIGLLAVLLCYKYLSLLMEQKYSSALHK